MSLASSTTKGTSATGITGAASITPSLTTTFVPTATTCTENRLTMLENRRWEIWNNMPVPVPGTTFSECYPSQYMTSYLRSAGGVTQAAFQPLVCPQNWSAMGPFTSNYIACCPSGYSLAPPSTTVFSDRPAFGGTCYTPIYEATPVRVTAYGLSGATATSLYTATASNAQAYAYPIDGFAFGVKEVQTIVSAPTSTASGSSATAQVTHTVLAGATPTFAPSSVNASVGDSVLFVFQSGNHSVTQSTFDTPCERVTGGFDSGFEANVNGAIIPSPNISYTVSSAGSQWFFSKQSNECPSGMVFAINPSISQPYSLFHSNALASASSASTSLSPGAKAGIAMGSVSAFILLVLSLLYFFRRRRQQASKRFSTGSKQGGEESWNGEEVVAAKEKPPVPPKGEELHDVCKPVEVPGYSSPVEMEERGWGRHEPVELWSPGADGREGGGVVGEKSEKR